MLSRLTRSGNKLMWTAGLCLVCLTAAALGRQVTLKALGCFIDFSNGIREMKGLKDYGFTSYGGAAVIQGSGIDRGFVYSTQQTHELCSNICSLGGFRYMALQAKNWCTCDYSYGKQGQAASANCSEVCSGKGSQNCGGALRNYVMELIYVYGDTLFVPGNRTLVGISKPEVPAYSTLTVRSLTDCTCHCDSLSSCQAVIFNEQQRLCHLLEYAVVPGALVGPDSGSFYVRG